MPSPAVILAALLSLCFSLACLLQAHSAQWLPQQSHSGSVLQMLFGDARRVFANQLFVKADVYFHNGYYPSMFDQARKPAQQQVVAATREEHGPEHDEHEHEREMDFLGKPKDLIDRFGRHFFASEHSHMEKAGAERELLPWLKLSAEMDPHRVDTYTVAAFWMRTRLGKTKEAEEFLRQGWRENPESYQILLELGRLYDQDLKDHERARNLWELALKKWQQQQAAKPEPDLYSYEQIVAHLADLEERDGHLPEAIAYLEKLEKVSPDPETIRKQITERKSKLQK